MANEIETRTITDEELCEIGRNYEIPNLPNLKITVEKAIWDYDNIHHSKEVTASDKKDLKKLSNSMRKTIRIWEDLSETAQGMVSNSAEYLSEAIGPDNLALSNEPEPDLLRGSRWLQFNPFTDGTFNEFFAAVKIAQSEIPASRKPHNARIRMLISDLWMWWEGTLERRVTMEHPEAYSPFERFLQDVVTVVDPTVSDKSLHTIFESMYRRNSKNRRRAAEQK